MELHKLLKDKVKDELSYKPKSSNPREYTMQNGSFGTSYNPMNQTVAVTLSSSDR